MKKLLAVVLVILSVLMILPTFETDSATQVFSRAGMAEGGL